VKHLLNTLLLILGRYVAYLVYSILGSENEYARTKFRTKGVCLHKLIQCMKESSSVIY
jgi:hypothetical protein